MTTNTNNIVSTVSVTRSWGSHGYSNSGVYWESWRNQLSETMTEEEFKAQSEKFAFDILEDKRQMGDSEQRPIFHLKRENT
jgi:hypothetical protein